MADHMTAEQEAEILDAAPKPLVRQLSKRRVTDMALRWRGQRNTAFSQLANARAQIEALRGKLEDAQRGCRERDSRLSGMAAMPATEGRIYIVNRIGIATLCSDEEDARDEAKDADAQWPHNGPHVVARLVAVPEGWKLVPLLPTGSMLDAAQTNETGGLITREARARIFRAMALAAKDPPHA